MEHVGDVEVGVTVVLHDDQPRPCTGGALPTADGGARLTDGAQMKCLKGLGGAVSPVLIERWMVRVPYAKRRRMR